MHPENSTGMTGKIERNMGKDHHRLAITIAIAIGIGIGIAISIGFDARNVSIAIPIAIAIQKDSAHGQKRSPRICHRPARKNVCVGCRNMA